MRWIKEFIERIYLNCTSPQGVTGVKGELVTQTWTRLDIYRIIWWWSRFLTSLRAYLRVCWLRSFELLSNFVRSWFGKLRFCDTSRTLAGDKLLIAFSWFLIEGIRFTFEIEWRWKNVHLLKRVWYRLDLTVFLFRMNYDPSHKHFYSPCMNVLIASQKELTAKL